MTSSTMAHVLQPQAQTALLPANGNMSSLQLALHDGTYEKADKGLKHKLSAKLTVKQRWHVGKHFKTPKQNLQMHLTLFTDNM
jgi:hypothetical protein